MPVVGARAGRETDGFGDSMKCPRCCV